MKIFDQLKSSKPDSCFRLLVCYPVKIIFVTGGGDVTVTSTADTSTFSNIRFEVGGYSNLYFDVPELTMTGIENSVSEIRRLSKYREMVPRHLIAVRPIHDDIFARRLGGRGGMRAVRGRMLEHGIRYFSEDSCCGR